MPSKVAIITGANRGIGLAIAKRLARDGANVLLAARDVELLDKAVSEIKNSGGQAASLALDLREPDAPTQLAERAVQLFGGINIVVNNAGATKRGNFLELSESDWADGFALKFYGSVRLSRAAWSHLKQSRGSLVNIVGVGGRTPGAAFAIGGSVNAALLSFTKAIAELGIQDGVQVNAINPGAIRTERFQNRLDAFARERDLSPAEAEAAMIRETQVTRIGEPDDIASLVAFVTSPEGRFLQGSLIDADGGQTKTL